MEENNVSKILDHKIEKFHSQLVDALRERLGNKKKSSPQPLGDLYGGNNDDEGALERIVMMGDAKGEKPFAGIIAFLHTLGADLEAVIRWEGVENPVVITTENIITGGGDHPREAPSSKRSGEP